MLKKAFGVYVNPDAVGWIKHESESSSVREPTVLREDTITVYAMNGIEILSVTRTLFGSAELHKYIQEIREGIEALGYIEEDWN